VPIRIPGRRAGRPDYSKTSTIPIIPPQPSNVLQIYWNTSDDIGGRHYILYFPQDDEGNYFPRKGKILRIKRLLISTDADTLMSVRCMEASRDDLEKALAGEITPDELIDRSYTFMLRMGYQYVEIPPIQYPITHPHIFAFGVLNEDTLEHKFWITLEGEEV